MGHVLGGAPENMGWISGAWQKNPLLLGYSGVVGENVEDFNLLGGNPAVDSTAVPVGEIHVITHIAIRYDGTIPTEIFAQLVQAGTAITLFQQIAPVSGLYYDRQGHYFLAPGDFLRMLIIGATAGNDAFMRIAGHRVDIDQ